MLSNFEKDSTPDGLEPGPSGLITLAYTSAGMAEVAGFFLRASTLTASNFAAN